MKMSNAITILVAKYTVSRSMVELRAAMSSDSTPAKQHYVPTLRTDNLRGARRAEMLRLRAAVRAEGFRVWPEQVPGEVAK
jgi:hypothetical protein